jgi:hypothetical protein
MKNFKVTRWCKDFTDNGKELILCHTPPEGMPYKFRLIDDDGIVGAIGYSMFDHNSYEDQVFAPLDYYSADYGFTSIEYQKGRKWIKI